MAQSPRRQAREKLTKLVQSIMHRADPRMMRGAKEKDGAYYGAQLALKELASMLAAEDITTQDFINRALNGRYSVPDSGTDNYNKYCQ